VPRGSMGAKLVIIHLSGLASTSTAFCRSSWSFCAAVRSPVNFTSSSCSRIAPSSSVGAGEYEGEASSSSVGAGEYEGDWVWAGKYEGEAGVEAWAAVGSVVDASPAAAAASASQAAAMAACTASPAAAMAAVTATAM